MADTFKDDIWGETAWGEEYWGGVRNKQEGVRRKKRRRPESSSRPTSPPASVSPSTPSLAIVLPNKSKG